MENITNKRKIINDPIYGFIALPGELIFDLIEHPWFQRLRRIKQLGLTNLVYPGALHTRFHHAIGAMYLMGQAIEVLRFKGVAISPEEEEGAYVAILLHDIGHGPFSHALEHSIIHGMNHEALSSLFIAELNKQFNGKLDLAIAIFEDTYAKRFLHQLVSGQLDVDRLDYLKRDSFYTGVSEGVINSDRIIKMIHVVENQLVVELKGIYSIEKFIVARRLMYWQVYLHKTVVGAESLLVNVLKRAKEIALQGVDLFATPAFRYFLYNEVSFEAIEKDQKILGLFAQLDDFDIMASIKVWCDHSDVVLAQLSKQLINRQLFHVEIQATPFSDDYLDKMVDAYAKAKGLTNAEAKYFVYSGKLENEAYKLDRNSIMILLKDNSLADLTSISDQLTSSSIAKPVVKYFICYPKGL